MENSVAKVSFESYGWQNLGGKEARWTSSAGPRGQLCQQCDALSLSPHTVYKVRASTLHTHTHVVRSVHSPCMYAVGFCLVYTKW